MPRFTCWRAVRATGTAAKTTSPTLPDTVWPFSSAAPFTSRGREGGREGVESSGGLEAHGLEEVVGADHPQGGQHPGGADLRTRPRRRPPGSPADNSWATAVASWVVSDPAVDVPARRTSNRLPAVVSRSVPVTTATMAMVRRRRMGFGRPGSAEPVAHAPDGGEGQLVPELLAQLAHVDVDGPLVAEPAFAPHPVEELAP